MYAMNVSLVFHQHFFGYIELVAHFTLLANSVGVSHVLSVAVILL